MSFSYFYYDFTPNAVSLLIFFHSCSEQTSQHIPHSFNKTQNRPRHCKDLLDAGDGQNGLRIIYPDPGLPDRYFVVYCDQTTDGGGWMIFQRRTNSSCPRENFSRSWKEYRMGFGNIGGEFWIGLDALHLLTSTVKQELRIDLFDWEGAHRYAKYDWFHVDGPEKYPVKFGR